MRVTTKKGEFLASEGVLVGHGWSLVNRHTRSEFRTIISEMLMLRIRTSGHQYFLDENAGLRYLIIDEEGLTPDFMTQYLARMSQVLEALHQLAESCGPMEIDYTILAGEFREWCKESRPTFDWGQIGTAGADIWLEPLPTGSRAGDGANEAVQRKTCTVIDITAHRRKVEEYHH